MNILITNDDGISAQGIRVLAEAAREFGTVTVVAPASQCSAMSHRITLDRPMKAIRQDLGIPGVTAFSVDGTPADCVRASLDAILPQTPDVVLSGINHGYNVGYDIAYSGTVGAAMEAQMSGIPAIAVSQNNLGSYENSAAYLPEILAELLETPCPSGGIWNVNIPTGNCLGIARDCTVAEGGYYKGKLYIREEAGVLHLQYPDLEPLDYSLHPAADGSDLRAVVNGYISIGRVRCTVM